MQRRLSTSHEKASWHDFARGMPFVPSFSTARRCDEDTLAVTTVREKGTENVDDRRGDQKGVLHMQGGKKEGREIYRETVRPGKNKKKRNETEEGGRGPGEPKERRNFISDIIFNMFLPLFT